MNKIILAGNMGKEPEVSYSGDKTYCKFTIACRRKYKDKDGNYGTDWFNCVGFGKTAEFIQKYFHKGSFALVTGHVQNETYTKNDGSTGYSTSVIVEDIEFGGKAGNSNEDTSAAKPMDDGFLNVPDGIVEELPFN